MTTYTIDAITNMSFTDLSYKLPDTIIGAIHKLISELNITTKDQPAENVREEVDSSQYRQKSRGFQKVFRGRKGGNRHDGFASPDESWERMREFKTTKIEKKEGVEKIINEVQNSNTKMSEQD